MLMTRHPLTYALTLFLGLSLGTLASPTVGTRADAPSVTEAITYWTRAYPSVSPWLVRRMIEIESGYNPGAYNPSGASGIMQFMPATYWAYRDELNNDRTLAPGLTAYDPEYGSLWEPWAAIHVAVHALYFGHGCAWVSYAVITGAC